MYHYTDETCLKEILKTRIIRASDNNLFGKGVYLCDLNPADNEEAAILMNNYGLYRKKNTDHKAQCYIKLKKNQLKGVYCRKLKRDKRVIWYYPEKSLNLDAVWFEHGYTRSAKISQNKQRATQAINKINQSSSTASRNRTSQQQQQQRTSYVKQPQNYSSHQTTSRPNYYDNSDYYYNYSRSYTKPAEPKKEPESEGWWSTILVLGTVAAIGYGLVKRFRG